MTPSRSLSEHDTARTCLYLYFGDEKWSGLTLYREEEPAPSPPPTSIFYPPNFDVVELMSLDWRHRFQIFQVYLSSELPDCLNIFRALQLIDTSQVENENTGLLRVT